MSTSRTKYSANLAAKSTANTQPLFAVDRQPSLFSDNLQPLPGSLNDRALVREVLVESIRRCGKSREQLADEMTLLTGEEMTARRLNGFTATSADDYRFPAELDRAFCAATADYRLLKCRVEAAGFFVITATEFQLLQLGREYLRQKRANEKVALLERGLQGVDL